MNRITRQASTKTQAHSFNPLQILRSHGQTLNNCAKKLLRDPLSNFMTILVIAIALALPMSLFVILQNTKTLTKGWDQGSQISLYLAIDTPSDAIDKTLSTIKLKNGVAHVTYISPEAALSDFRTQSGFGDIVDRLPQNPLPPVIEVTPDMTLTSPAQIQNLLNNLKQLPHIDSAQLDIEWVKRLYQIIQLGQRAFYALILLFSFAVILIIGNTIRLLTQNQREEIEVIKLIGGTNAFIRRPFLYTGILYGFFGGVIAWLLVDSELYWLATPLRALTQTYGSEFQMTVVALAQGISLVLGGTLLGFLGAYITAQRQIRRFDPNHVA